MSKRRVLVIIWVSWAMALALILLSRGYSDDREFAAKRREISYEER